MANVRTLPVDDPAAWTGAQLAGRDDWMYRITENDAAEILAAVDANRNRPMLEVTLADFPLPALSARLRSLAANVDRGAGLALIRGLPIGDMDEDAAALALWGMGQHVGRPQFQDASRALLHHVRDTGGDWLADPGRRVYETNAEQVFHNDGGDLVMLLCRRAAKRGGTSRMVSAVTLFNEVLKRDPDLARVLQEPFAFDARNQQLPGRPAVQRVPIFIWHAGRMNVLHKRHYIETALRFDDVPALTDAQVAALDLVDQLCDDPEIQLAFELSPGDIQMACNFTILHARDSFEDHDEPEKKRHMLRLWLGLADGRPLPETYRETREFGPLFEIEGRASSPG